MAKLTLITPWTGSGAKGNAYRPQFTEHYPGVGWTDITAQESKNLIPSVNLYILEVECSDAQATTIKADSRYLVLTDGVTLSDTATFSTAQVNAAKTWLTARGLTVADLVGKLTVGMTRKQVREALRDFARTWKKA
jgi:hypothetical protein